MNYLFFTLFCFFSVRVLRLDVTVLSVVLWVTAGIGYMTSAGWFD